MKRFFITSALVLAATAAHAQFSEGTKYLSTSVTGLSMSHSKSAEFNVGLNAEGGYYFADGWMVRGTFGYNHAKTLDAFSLGGGVRYSFLQNGIYIGAGLEYAFDKYSRVETVHHKDVTTTFTQIPAIDADGNPCLTYESQTSTSEYDTSHESVERVNNIRIPIEIGYTFYINHYLAVEPAIYSKMSLNHFSEGTEFGLKVGLGFYFDRIYKQRRLIRRSGL